MFAGLASEQVGGIRGKYMIFRQLCKDCRGRMTNRRQSMDRMYSQKVKPI